MGWKLFMLKVRWLSWKYEIINKIKKNLYCKKGFHKISKCTWSTKAPKKKEIKISYYTCSLCGLNFFNSEKDTEIYKKLKERERESWEMMFKAITEKCKKK